MRKKLLVVTFLLVSIFCLNLSVYAEDAENTCTYKDKANLNKLAGSVEIVYDVQQKEDGTYKFIMKVYNITSELYINVTNDYDKDFYLTIVSSETTNGTYSFEIDDDSNVIKYTFVIKSTNFACTGSLKTINVIKPKKNKYHDYNECKFTDTENYTYCQEWITREITLSESEVLNKIAEQRSYNKKITSTTCANCSSDVRLKSRLELIKMYKRFIVIGLSIGIALIIIYIYLKISNIRRAEL